MNTLAHNTDVIGKGRRESAQKVLIAYHAHCIDGYTSAWACWRGLLQTTSILSENIDIEAASYDDLLFLGEVADRYDKIYLVDFSVPLETLKYLSSVSEVMIIDHHKSAFERYSENFLPDLKAPGHFEHSDLYGARILMDMNECGASLVWKHFFPGGPIPMLIQYVRDYDLWQFEFPATKAVNKYLRLQKQNLVNWQRLEGMFEAPIKLAVAIDIGRAMLEYHKSIVAELVEQAEGCTLNEIDGLVVNCSPQFSSDVGHELASLCNTFGATWQQEPGGKVKWSLRSNGDECDVAELAQAFGGGGHKNAAGFYLSAPQESVTSLGITIWPGDK